MSGHTNSQRTNTTFQSTKCRFTYPESFAGTESSVEVLVSGSLVLGFIPDCGGRDEAGADHHLGRDGAQRRRRDHLHVALVRLFGTRDALYFQQTSEVK